MPRAMNFTPGYICGPSRGRLSLESGLTMPMVTVWDMVCSFLQSELHLLVRALLLREIAAGRDEVLELCFGNGNARDDAADAARFLVEVPDELAASPLFRVDLAVLRVDRDARPEERHRVRRDERRALH